LKNEKQSVFHEKFKVIFILDSGRLFTFGSNKYGQLGLGDFKKHHGANLIVGPLVGHYVTNAACGDSFTICSTSGRC
jgi:NIMA (never in mitosis gene a)-related kinase